MNFEWDEVKRKSNLDKHGIDFRRAQRIFDGRPRVDIASPRHSEYRALSIALLDDRLAAVAWTPREPGLIRIISARRAGRAEERQYRQLHG
jgi:uncharacterized protein